MASPSVHLTGFLLPGTFYSSMFPYVRGFNRTDLIMSRHLRFVARTVMVQNGNLDAAYTTLNRVLTQEGIVETVKRKRYFEKPCRERQRKNFENCRRIYHMEMARKISFISKTSREDPWLGYTSCRVLFPFPSHNTYTCCRSKCCGIYSLTSQRMNSLGSSSKWPSYDSLPSTSSFVFSESDQTEDEADIFSEGEGDIGGRKSLSADERIEFSQNASDFPAHSDHPHLRSKSDQTEHCPSETKHPDSASSPGAATLGSSAMTPGDLAFAHKCADLHRFIRPLLELLHGLKTGRFDKGLTSFQQSVAIDRLQRILGILQKPEMGEKYLRNLLQIEMMLKMWFPQVAFRPVDTPTQTITTQLPQHWCQNQLHMPVKVSFMLDVTFVTNRERPYKNCVLIKSWTK
ncbi:hypothetical protein INR49_027490 [Caranx melampygus]|nr:hypothetical protein INR49_027490 [Caranx melampygus]